MRQLKSLAYGALCLTVACGGGTGGQDAGPKPETQCDGGEGSVSYSTVYSSIIAPTCLNGCHAGGTTLGPVVMTSADAGYQNSVGKVSVAYGTGPKVVDPSKPGNSTLYLKTLGGTPAGYRAANGESVGGIMPQDATVGLNTTQKETLRKWICGGAQP
jgi:hypothetical protein